MVLSIPSGPDQLCSHILYHSNFKTMARFIFSSLLILVLSAGLFSHLEAHSLADQSDCDIVLVDHPNLSLSGVASEPLMLPAPTLEFPYLVSISEFDSRTVYRTEGWHPDLRLLVNDYQGYAYRGERAFLNKV